MLGLWITRRQYCPQALHSGAHMTNPFRKDSYLPEQNPSDPCFSAEGHVSVDNGHNFLSPCRLSGMIF